MDEIIMDYLLIKYIINMNKMSYSNYKNGRNGYLVKFKVQVSCLNSWLPLVQRLGRAINTYTHAPSETALFRASSVSADHFPISRSRTEPVSGQ
jgi:hypothetical protein